jgi:hypothetical protein
MLSLERVNRDAIEQGSLNFLTKQLKARSNGKRYACLPTHNVMTIKKS